MGFLSISQFGSSKSIFFYNYSGERDEEQLSTSSSSKNGQEDTSCLGGTFFNPRKRKELKTLSEEKTLNETEQEDAVASQPSTKKNRVFAPIKTEPLSMDEEKDSGSFDDSLDIDDLAAADALLSLLHSAPDPERTCSKFSLFKLIIRR